MLKKEFRLKKRDDFLEIKCAKNIKWGKYFGVSNLSSGDFKLGFLVTKKVMPRAVDRNRFRRVFVEAAREIGLPEHNWFVIIAKKEALKIKLVEMKNEISNFASFANL